jgi:hypothetical protein
MTVTVDQITTDIRALLKAEYERGFRDGQVAMRKHILNLASTGEQVIVSSVGHAVGVSEARGRAPRGAVGRALEQVLTESPGLTITEIEARAVALDPEISAKSVGNDLRRLEGKRYRRDRPKGYRWYLIGAAGQDETAGTP